MKTIYLIQLPSKKVVSQLFARVVRRHINQMLYMQRVREFRPRRKWPPDPRGIFLQGLHELLLLTAVGAHSPESGI
jgi:hypothetical protein